MLGKEFQMKTRLGQFNVKDLIEKTRKTVSALIIRNAVDHYVDVLSEMMKQEILTAKEILDDKSVEKLATDVGAAILENREGLISLKAHWQKFMVRIENKMNHKYEENASMRHLEELSGEIAEIWKV